MATTYPNPVPVQVCLVVALPGGNKSVSVPMQGTMYDEPNASAPYKKCIALSGLDDSGLPKDANSNWQLHDWVRSVTTVVVYPPSGPAPEAVDIGGVGVIGLTSVTIQTETKGIAALNAVPIAPFTAAGLKAIGL